MQRACAAPAVIRSVATSLPWKERIVSDLEPCTCARCGSVRTATGATLPPEAAGPGSVGVECSASVPSTPDADSHIMAVRPGNDAFSHPRLKLVVHEPFPLLSRLLRSAPP